MMIKGIWEGLQVAIKITGAAFFVGLGFALGVVTALAYWATLP